MTTVSGTAPAPTRQASGSGALAKLARLAVGAGKKVEDDKEKEKEAEKDKEEKDAKDEKDDKAEEEKDDDKAEDDSDEEEGKEKDDDEEAQGKGDDGDDEKDKKSKKAARMSERARIRRILTSKHAMLSEQHYANAAYIAFETNMNSSEAIGMLRCMPVTEPAPAAQQQRDPLRQRMDQTPQPRVASDGNTGNGPDLASQIIAAGKKRRNET